MNRRRFIGGIGSCLIGCFVGTFPFIRERSGTLSPGPLTLSNSAHDLEPVFDPQFETALDAVATRDLFESLLAQGVLTRTGVDMERLADACGSDEVVSFASQRYARTELELYTLAARVVTRSPRHAG